MNESRLLEQQADQEERNAEQSRQKQSGKQGDLERMETQKADAVHHHEANIAAFRRQIDSIQAEITVEESQLQRDIQAFDAQLAKVKSETEDHAHNAEAAHSHAEQLRAAAEAAKLKEIADHNKEA